MNNVILVIAANPRGTTPLALDHESRSIRVALERSKLGDRFELITHGAAQPHDLLHALRTLRPTIVHFSGHGRTGQASPTSEAANRDVIVAREDVGSPGLYFEGPDGRAKLVSADALATTFKAAGASVRLVVLNACYSELQAAGLLTCVDCVIGMHGPITDEAAVSFVTGFYGALGDRAPVAAAFEHGRAAIHLDGLTDADRPQLKVRPGIDPARVIPAAQPRIEIACPYPGMQPYSAEDARHFHGRAPESHKLVRWLHAGVREIYVIGDSGCGKSSLIAAGVLPQLTNGFVVRAMRPGAQPAARLRQLLEVSADRWATAIDDLLAAQPAPASLLLWIDQLEELFTLADADEQAELFHALKVMQAHPRCVLLFTIRTDFDRIARESLLWTGRQSEVELERLRGHSLAEAIARPARELGVHIEPELLERLLAHAGNERGALPLLQETLVELWDRRQDQAITLRDYEALADRHPHGLASALVSRADAALRALPPADLAIARRILLRLISLGEGQPDTRRPLPVEKLRSVGERERAFDRVLQLLITHRLVVTYAGCDHKQYVDLAHEVMIVAWPTLAEWLKTYRVEEQRRRKFEAAAAEHADRRRGVLDAIELRDAEAWQRSPAARELGHGKDVIELLAASRRSHQHRRWLHKGVLAGVFLLLAVFAMMATVIARAPKNKAMDNAYVAYAFSGAIVFHLRDQVEIVKQIAAAPEMSARGPGDHAALEAILEQHRFESLSLLDTQCTMLVHAVRKDLHASLKRDVTGESYAGRAYCIEARKLGAAKQKGVYVSPIFTSRSTGNHTLGLVTPVYDSHGAWTRILLLTIGTNFALQQDPDLKNRPEVVSIVGPRDRAWGSNEDTAGKYSVIFHRGIPSGQGVDIDSPRLREIAETSTRSDQLSLTYPKKFELITDEDYRDPVLGYAGRWLAGFSPIGGTGFAVIVQTRYDDGFVIGNMRLSYRVLMIGAILLFVWLISFGLLQRWFL